MSAGMNEAEEDFYVLSPEKGLCLVGEAIINLAEIVMIQRQGERTLIYRAGVAEPIALGAEAFEIIRDTVFVADDVEEEEDDGEYEEDDE